MKRILYATDGSCGALAAGKHLSHLPHRRDVHVHIITILPVHAPTAAAEAILETAAESLGNFPGHVTTAVTRGETTGEIADLILATAGYIHADLVVVGACGRSGALRFLIGSVTERVVREAGCPVLIARDTPFSNELIVGVDGSQGARDAARFVADTLPPERDICLLHTIQPPASALTLDTVMAGVYYQAVGREEERERTAALGYMQTIADDIANGIRRVNFVVATGSPVEGIVRAAEARKVDLIVVGATGKSGFLAGYLGGVAERVIRRAPCSVLVARLKHPVPMAASVSAVPVASAWW